MCGCAEGPAAMTSNPCRNIWMACGLKSVRRHCSIGEPLRSAGRFIQLQGGVNWLISSKVSGIGSPDTGPVHFLPFTAW